MNNITEIIERYSPATRNSLIPLLQEVQAAQGFVSREAVEAVGAHLGLSTAKVYGVATFYNQFRFHPAGRFHIQLCRGTACHVKGSSTLQATLEHMLGIKAGQTSPDGLFSLEVVACIGACGLAPVIAINGEFHAAVTPSKLERIIAACRATVKAEAVEDDHGNV